MSGSNIGIKEIAAAAGVSIATVSRHLSGKTIRTAYRQRVETALSSLDYRPNLGARRLRSGDAGLIGLVVPDIGNPFFVAFIRAVETLAWREERRVILCNSDENPDREVRLLRMLEDERVSGIIIAPAVGSAPPVTTVPTVLVDRSFPGSEHDAVLLDNANAAASLVDSLQAAGHRRILGVFGEWGITADERRQGFTDRIAAHELSMSIILVPYDPVARRAILRRTVDEHEIDAIVCGDSLILLDAAIAIDGTCQQGTRLAGFDNAEWLQLTRRAPIVLEQPIEEMAHATLALLTSRITGNEGAPVTMAFRGQIASAQWPASVDQAENG